MKRFASFSAISLLLFLLGMMIVCVYGEVDKTSTVTRVIDGDTFDISNGERIRLADVDAPEYYESGYSQAKDYLVSLIDEKTIYLDIDDIYTYDYSGKGDRLVCVAYVDYDSTHLMNVNKALLDGGYAVISNYNNEFSPYSWSLLVLKDVVPELTSSLSPSLAPTPTPAPSASPYPSFSPTPEPDSDFSEDYLNVAVAILADILVIAIFIMTNKMGKK
jgi:endonuclease YncB( thermonuclease family)